MRRLPIFLVVDVSESMVGDNLQYMQNGLKQLLTLLRQDPNALDTVHLSLIAFAGVAGTLIPLTEVASFPPFELPLGSGTSVGSALQYVMNEIDRNIISNSLAKKGDYKPIVFFMSDGKATDNPQPAIKHWQQKFQSRATFVSIGIGPYADLSQLSPISQQSLRLENADEANLNQFILWLSQSIGAQSRSLGLDIPLTLNKSETPFISLVKDAESAEAVDEDYAIITGLCRHKKLPYLMKFERLPSLQDIPSFTLQQSGNYFFTGVYAAGEDYFNWSDPRAHHQVVTASQLYGGGGCPHCGADIGLSVCHCGQIFCMNDSETEVTCPSCQQNIVMACNEDGEDFDILRSRG